MIKKIKLKFGSSASKPALETALTPITVFVGPNNSGKSKILFEIEEFCKKGKTNTQNVILNEVIFLPITDAESEITKHTLIPKTNETLAPQEIVFGNSKVRHQVNRNELVKYF